MAHFISVIIFYETENLNHSSNTDTSNKVTLKLWNRFSSLKQTKKFTEAFRLKVILPICGIFNTKKLNLTIILKQKLLELSFND